MLGRVVDLVYNLMYKTIYRHVIPASWYQEAMEKYNWALNRWSEAQRELAIWKLRAHGYNVDEKEMRIEITKDIRKAYNELMDLFDSVEFLEFPFPLYWIDKSTLKVNMWKVIYKGKEYKDGDVIIIY